MFRLAAPASGPLTTTLLPNPKFSDHDRLRATVTIRRTIDGAIHTYVKKKSKSKSYLWDFKLTKNKALELLEFYKAYNADEVLVYWEDRTYRGYIKNNPLEASTEGTALESLGGSYVRATIELEEKG